MSPRQFRLPDLLASCPLKDATNPYYKEASAAMTFLRTENGLSLSRARMNSFVHMYTLMLVTNSFARLAILYVFVLRLLFKRIKIDFVPQVNLLFVVDEVSDDQNGMDARTTGRIFVNAMKYPKWDDGSKLARITKE
jgi:hypothetical protein